MPPRGPQIPLPKRAAILALHWHAEKSWIEISTLLKVHPDTARKICVRAKERSTDPNDFDDVLQHLEDAERPGRPPKSSRDEDSRGLDLGGLRAKGGELGLTEGDCTDLHNVDEGEGDKGYVRTE